MIEDDIDEDADASVLARLYHSTELVPVATFTGELRRHTLVRRPPLATLDVLAGGRDLDVGVAELADGCALSLDSIPVPLKELHDDGWEASQY
jgi:hypothetical protein